MADLPPAQRIVRAEIEAEFAHKVGKELEGKDVMIFDNTDSRLSYRGKVRTISGTFLPKLAPSDSCLPVQPACWKLSSRLPIRPHPKIPPLRVGQRVVGMGQ